MERGCAWPWRLGAWTCCSATTRSAESSSPATGRGASQRPLISATASAPCRLSMASRYAVFDAEWRHVRTVDAVTGDTVLTVSYDDGGPALRGQGQADFNVVQLRVTRNPNGTPSALVGTGTTATSIAVDSNGHLAGVVRGDGSTLFVTENDLGLVRTWQKMGRGAVSYEYDDAGRLTKATDPDGVTQQLAFEAGAGSVAVTITDTTGGTAIVRADRDGDTIRRSFTDTDGTVTQLDTNPDGSTRLTRSRRGREHLRGRASSAVGTGGAGTDAHSSKRGPTAPNTASKRRPRWARARLSRLPPGRRNTQWTVPGTSTRTTRQRARSPGRIHRAGRARSRSMTARALSAIGCRVCRRTRSPTTGQDGSWSDDRRGRVGGTDDLCVQPR